MPTRRYVTAVQTDKKGEIVALCNPGEVWSPRLKHSVIADIEVGAHTYWIEAEVLANETGKHILAHLLPPVGSILDVEDGRF